jgi:TRAP-type C4-dicarboxylate transport system permease small subunit
MQQRLADFRNTASRPLADLALKGIFKLLDYILVGCLGAIMVLGNVILRYGFNSGITESEELSRFLFVWLTFIGAIVGVRENAHLGVDTLVRRLPPAGKKVCLVVSELAMLFCCGLFFWGMWQQREVNLSNYAPVSGLPMEVVYAVAYVCSGAIAILVVAKLVRLARGRLAEDELIQVQESEEQHVVKELQAQYQAAQPAGAKS